MKAMMHAYHGELMSQGGISKAERHHEAPVKAYDLCCPASNYYTQDCLNDAAAAGFDIAHGTTMTGPHVGAMMQSLKDVGYDVHLILVAAPDDVRAKAADYRQYTQNNYQSTADDVRTKGDAFHERIPVYLIKQIG